MLLRFLSVVHPVVHPVSHATHWNAASIIVLACVFACLGILIIPKKK